MTLLDNALAEYYQTPVHKQPLRFGQFCLNRFDQLPRPWPELFYEKDTINAIEMLKQWEATGSP